MSFNHTERHVHWMGTSDMITSRELAEANVGGRVGHYVRGPLSPEWGPYASFFVPDLTNVLRLSAPPAVRGAILSHQSPAPTSTTAGRSKHDVSKASV